MSKKPNPSHQSEQAEPALDDFVALVRKRMIENGEDPNAQENNSMDFSGEEDDSCLH